MWRRLLISGTVSDLTFGYGYALKQNTFASLNNNNDIDSRVGRRFRLNGRTEGKVIILIFHQISWMAEWAGATAAQAISFTTIKCNVMGSGVWNWVFLIKENQNLISTNSQVHSIWPFGPFIIFLHRRSIFPARPPNECCGPHERTSSKRQIIVMSSRLVGKLQINRAKIPHRRTFLIPPAPSPLCSGR